MRRFHFRLQTLLDRRRAREDELLIELSVVSSELAAELVRLEQLKGISAEAFRRLAEGLEDPIDAPEMLRRDNYARSTLDDIEVQKLTIEAAHKRVEAKRNEVVEAMKDRKVLESVREKQETQHVLAERKTEQQLIDEISSVRYARGM